MTFFMKGLRAIYLVLLVAIVLPYGSVAPLPLHILASGMLGVTVLALLSGPIAPPTRKLIVGTTLLAMLLCGWIVLQTTGVLGASAIWSDAGHSLGTALPPSLSVQPADTLAALVQCMLPFGAFIAGLILFAGDRPAGFLLRFLVTSGTMLAALGLVQFTVLPEMLLIFEKEHYRDSLTLVFVNRNTAATYLGIMLVVCAAMAIRPLRILLSRMRAALVHNAKLQIGAESLWLVPLVLGMMILFGALMLTQSRAGIAAAMAGLVVSTAILIFEKNPDPLRRRYRRRGSRSIWGPITRLALALAIVVGLGFVFAGRALLRAQIHAGEDARFCMLPRMLELLQDNWLLGTGLGTFHQAFASYRDPACGIYGTWDMAHNFYLEGWITLGLPFVIACVVSLVWLLAAFIVGVARRRRQRWVAVAGLSALLVTAVHSAIDFSLQIPGFSVTFAAIMASCATISLRNPTAQPQRR